MSKRKPVDGGKTPEPPNLFTGFVPNDKVRSGSDPNDVKR